MPKKRKSIKLIILAILSIVYWLLPHPASATNISGSWTAGNYSGDYVVTASTTVSGIVYVVGGNITINAPLTLSAGSTLKFDTGYHITKNTGGSITKGAGAQIQKAAASPTCYSGGNPQTTNWGANLYSCTGASSRCYSGQCWTCSGYLYSDGCSGCAGQGGNACWHYNGVVDTSCNSICTSYGGCVAANWNDDGSACHALTGCSVYGGAGNNYNPLYWPGNQCQNRSAGGQDCSAYYPGGMTHASRICVCNY